MSFAADLDMMLDDAGRDVILRRVVGTDEQLNVDCTCRAFAREVNQDEMQGGAVQGDWMVIMGMRGIDVAQWPGGQPVLSPPDPTDPRIPSKGDKVVIDGRERTVINAKPVYDGPTLFRLDITARG